jgi:hypothetical protein
MRRRKRRDDYLDARITSKAVDLFRLARRMRRQGFDGYSRELTEVSIAIDRELGIRPWMPAALDFEIFAMDAKSFPPHADFAVVKELHSRLVEAAT